MVAFKNRSIQLVASIVSLLVTTVTLGIILLESLAYPGYILKNFGITPVQAFLTGAVILLLLRVIFSLKLKDNLYWWLCTVITPFVSLFALFIHITNELWYANFSFSIFHLHSEPFKLVSVFFVAITLIFFNYQSIKHSWQKPFFALPLIVVPNLAFFKWAYEDAIFWYMKREDGIIEYVTAAAFFLMSYFAFKTWKKVRHSDLTSGIKKLLLVFYGLMTFGSFLIGAEEISWGQRILGIETPEEIAKYNTQEEITIHNNVVIINYVYHAYLLLSIYASTAWLISIIGKNSLSPKAKAWLALLTPSWYIACYFIPEIIYVLGRYKYEYPIVGTWEEVSEMILSLGLLFYAIDSYKRISLNTRPFLKENTN